MSDISIGSRVAWVFADEVRGGVVTSFRWRENGASAHIESDDGGWHSVDVDLLYPIYEEVKG